MILEVERVDSDRFQSARGNDALLEIVRLKIEDRSFHVRITIELGVFATIEVWSLDGLEWSEIHTIPTPIVRPTIAANVTVLTKIGISVLKG